MNKKIISSAMAICLLFLSGQSAAELSLFANIKKEREVMVSRDAVREFIKEHQASDPNFQYIRGIRGFYGSTLAVDVYPQFLSLDAKVQDKVAQLLLDSWTISLPKHLQFANLELYVENEKNPFLSRRFLKY